MKVNVELIKSTLELIEKNPQHWDQEEWHCGTTHCFAGFVELQVKNLPIDKPFDGKGNTEDLAKEHLGISEAAADVLFNYENSLDDLKAYCDILLNKRSFSHDLNSDEKILFLQTDLPSNTLKALAEDFDPVVRAAITQLSDLPGDFIEMLATDKSPFVRMAIANRPDLPSDIIEMLATDESPYVRMTIAERPALPRDVINILATDKHDLVRTAIAEFPNLPSDIVDMLATDKSYLVRTAIAECQIC